MPLSERNYTSPYLTSGINGKSVLLPRNYWIYQVIDKHFGPVGVITGVNDATAQPLFEIDNEGKEVLIPVNDQFIELVDEKTKRFI